MGDMVANAVLLMLSQKLKLMPTMATVAMEDMEVMVDTDTAANADLLLLKLPQLHTTVMVDTEGTDTDMDVNILSCMKYINKSFPSLLNIQRKNHYASPMIFLSQKCKGDF